MKENRSNQRPESGQIIEIILTCSPIYELPSNIKNHAWERERVGIPLGLIWTVNTVII